MKIEKDIVLEGEFVFQTLKTGRGRDRYLAKVKGVLPDGKAVSAQCFGDWDGKFPKSMELVNSNGYRSLETGLIRSVSGALKGKVKVAAGTEVAERPGDVAGVVLRQVEITDPDAFQVEATGREYSACTL